MGYTHYWHRKEEFNKKNFEKLVKSFKDLYDKEFTNLIANWDGKKDSKPTINEHEITFNGIENESHETFSMPLKREMDEHEKSFQNSIRNPLIFDFCKTAVKEYDIAVVTCLILAKYYLKNQIKISSDGDLKDWEDARNLIYYELHLRLYLKTDSDGGIIVKKLVKC